MKNIILVIIQIISTFVVSFCIYMLFALLDNDFGIDGFFGLFVFQPLFAVVLSVLTIFACLIAGLPIRLSKKINHWWRVHFYIAILGFICGLTLLFLSLIPPFMETVIIDNEMQQSCKQVPNTLFVSVGWLLTAFSLLHVYPPLQFTNKRTR